MDSNEAHKAKIKEIYKQQRINQTVEYNRKIREEWLNFLDRVMNDQRNMTVMSALEKLEQYFDPSEASEASDQSDLKSIKLLNLYQTAEKLRNDGEPDWLQLVGLIHHLGKIMYFWGCDEEGTSYHSKWGVIGNTFIVGAKLPEKIVFPEFNSLNIDMQNKKYNTELGQYSKGCGLKELTKSWGQNEYLYKVLKFNDCKIPEAGLKIIRYHSLHLWHTYGAYSYFENDDDKKIKPLIQRFQKAKLCTKNVPCNKNDLPFLREYYGQLIEKYIGCKELVW
jgi:inositol oxygenase